MRAFATILFGSVFLAVATASAASDPRGQTDELLKAFIKDTPLPDDGSDLSDADKAANQKVFSELDSYFHYETFTKGCLGPHASKFSAEQRSKFDNMFKELIQRIAYPDSGAFLATSQNKLNPAKKKGGKATVLLNVEVPEDDLELETTFHWQNLGGWKLVDVAFDGASLVKDYQNQFGRIIAKDGVDGLLKKVEKRLKKARKDSVI